MIFLGRSNHIFAQLFFGFFVGLALISCSPKPDDSTNLLAVAVDSTNVLRFDELNQKLSQIAPSAKPDLFHILSELWPEPRAKDRVIAINQLKDTQSDTYAAILIFDNISDGDSVSGYRYEIKLSKSAMGSWKITEARKSWRCWPDRGHRTFSVKPCT